MNKAAVSLISLEPVTHDIHEGFHDAQKGERSAPAEKSSGSQGLLAALVYDSLGDILSQVQDHFQPVELTRVHSAQEVLTLVEGSDTALVFADLEKPEHAFQLLLTLKLIKGAIRSGQVRVIVNCGIRSRTLEEKLKLNGCNEIIHGLEQPEQVVRKARMMAELLLFRRAVERLPGGKLTSVGLVFMISEWISQNGIDYPSMAHLFCACLSAACAGAHFEFLARGPELWECVATSDQGESRWLKMISEAPTGTSEGVTEARIEWIGDRSAALVCSATESLGPEQERLLQAAADLASDFTFLAQPRRVASRSGLKC